MSEPVSVLITCYQGAPYLAPCLESVLTQSLSDFELVVIDDGSDDQSPEILRAFAAKDRRVRPFFLPKNTGVPEAANFGLAQLRHPWVARLDADDLMLPERLEAQRALAEETGGLVGSQVQLIGKTTRGQREYIAWSNGLLTPEDISRESYRELPLPHPSWFGPKELFSSQNYRQMSWAEDYDLLMRSLQAGWPVHKVPELLTQKRETGVGLSSWASPYKRPAMFSAKAHFLVRSGLGSERPWWVFGSGPSGRLLAKALLDQGQSVAGFMDNVSGKGRRVLGLPVRHLSAEGTELEDLDSAFKLLCIGQPKARKQMIRLLEARGEREGQDWIALL
ncbi:MAG: glycosyltransferase family 2 protein [bacterium]|nr:glycosyltransferase family 2 protein [bacterium]